MICLGKGVGLEGEGQGLQDQSQPALSVLECEAGELP